MPWKNHHCNQYGRSRHGYCAGRQCGKTGEPDGKRRKPVCGRENAPDRATAFGMASIARPGRCRRRFAYRRHRAARISPNRQSTARARRPSGRSRLFALYLSLEDPLLRIFAGERVRAMMERLKMPDGEAIEAGIVTRSIESAQRRVEAHNFDMRKQLLEYDDVANDQRRVIYQQRNELLEAGEISDTIAAIREDVLSERVRAFVPPQSIEEEWNLSGLEQALRDDWHLELNLAQRIHEADLHGAERIEQAALSAAEQAYQAKVALLGREHFNSFERSVMLQILDARWREHLAALDHKRQDIHLRGYAQKNPKQEYKREAFNLFEQLLSEIKFEVTRLLLTVKIHTPNDIDQFEQHASAPENLHFQHAAQDSAFAFGIRDQEAVEFPKPSDN